MPVRAWSTHAHDNFGAVRVTLEHSATLRASEVQQQHVQMPVTDQFGNKIDMKGWVTRMGS